MVYRPRTRAKVSRKSRRCVKCGALTGRRRRCKRCHLVQN